MLEYKIILNNYHSWFIRTENETGIFVFHIKDDKIIKIEEGDNIIYSGKFETTDNIINLSIIMYMFLGTIFAIKQEDIDLNKLRDMIYNIVINKHINFINLSLCGCNMGNCCSIVDYLINKLYFKTIEDLIKFYSGNIKVRINDIEVYEYPDSMMMEIKRFEDKTIILYDYMHKLKDTVDLSEHKDLYSLTWGR